MRIGIDCRMGGTGEGIGRYVEELVRNLVEIDHSNEYFLLIDSKRSIEQIESIRNPNFHRVKIVSHYYSVAEQTYFIWELLRLKLDLVHFASFNVPIFYPKKFVVTIHDVIHHQFPGRKKFRIIHRLAYRLVIALAAGRAAKIIAVSEATKTDIMKIFKVPARKISVVYEGVDPRFISRGPEFAKVLARCQIAKPFLLFVGVWRQYKNLPRLAAAFDIIRDKYQIDCQFVLAGKIDDFYPEIKAQVQSIKNAKDIRALGFVPETDLAVLYHAAKILVLPSLVEGFGLAGIEAQAAGTLVTASDIPVLREILADGAIYFNPQDEEDMARKIAGLWRDETAAQNLKDKAARNLARFDWAETARQTLNLYNTEYHGGN